MTELTIGFYCSTQVVEFRCVTIYGPILAVNQKHFQKQEDGYDCELFAIAFTADILQGILPTKSCFNVSRIREHLIECLEKEKLSVFPKQVSVTVNKVY